MDPIRNHRKKTFIHLQISNANALQYTNPTFRTNANSYQTTQPINSIATNRGFSATEQRKQKFLFNITKIIHSDTLHSPKEHPSIFGVSPLPPSLFFLLRMNKAYRLDLSVQTTHKPEVERSIVKRLHWHIWQYTNFLWALAYPGLPWFQGPSVLF